MRFTRLSGALCELCALRKKLQTKPKNKRRHGFTLIELLAAAAIIGVLVTLAMPRYKAFIARSRQAEAKSNLGTISKLQEAFYMNKAALNPTGSYSSGMTGYGAGGKCGTGVAEGGNELGFRLSDCARARYRYVAKTGPDEATGGSSVSSNVYPDCTKDDTWKISKGAGSLTNDPDVVTKCND